MDSLQTAPISAESLPRRRLRRRLFLLIAFALLALDQVTKWLVVTHIPRGGSVPVCSMLRLTHTYNTGVAFGMWATGGKALAVAAALCIVVLLIWGARYASRSALVAWALACLVGGALGNLADRIQLGHVIDFMDFRFWPVFNLADACVVCGAILLLIHGLVTREPSCPAAQPAPERSES